MENFKKLKEILLAAENDATKFFVGGTKAAGTRLRKSMQEIRILAQEIRKEVTATRAAAATKEETKA